MKTTVEYISKHLHRTVFIVEATSHTTITAKFGAVRTHMP
jgi:hypothetical protein